MEKELIVKNEAVKESAQLSLVEEVVQLPIAEESVMEIKKSYNYDEFGFIEGNRKVNSCNYAKLERSMLEKQLIIPICVNKDKKIIDGQHRFTVAKNNNLPVYYYVVEEYDIEEVKRANMVSRNWTKKDFLELQIENEQEDYLLFNFLLDIYKISIQDLIKIFSAFQGIKFPLLAKDFEEGKFTSDKSDKVEDFLKALDDFKEFRYYNTKAFVSAFLKIYVQEQYNHTRMKERLRTRFKVITKKTTADDYIVHLTRDVYSFGVTRKPLFYDSSNKKFYS